MSPPGELEMEQEIHYDPLLYLMIYASVLSSCAQIAEAYSEHRSVTAVSLMRGSFLEGTRRQREGVDAEKQASHISYK